MKNQVTVVLVFFVHFFALCQKISGEIGFSKNQFTMESINRFYMDSFAMQPQINLFHDYISSGKQMHVNLSYRAKDLFSVGVYSSFQQGGSTAYPVTTVTDDLGFLLSYHRGIFEINTNAFSFGLSNTWYISHLLKFQEKETTLNRVHFGVELMGGYGFSLIKLDLNYPTLEFIDFPAYRYTANAFQCQFGLKIEYDFIKNPIITSLGVRGGYQYFRTGNVKNKLNEEWVVLDKYPMNLDFSGLYFGVYLKLGR